MIKTEKTGFVTYSELDHMRGTEFHFELHYTTTTYNAQKVTLSLR